MSSASSNANSNIHEVIARAFHGSVRDGAVALTGVQATGLRQAAGAGRQSGVEATACVTASAGSATAFAVATDTGTGADPGMGPGVSAGAASTCCSHSATFETCATIAGDIKPRVCTAAGRAREGVTAGVDASSAPDTPGRTRSYSFRHTRHVQDASQRHATATT